MYCALCAGALRARSCPSVARGTTSNTAHPSFLISCAATALALDSSGGETERVLSSPLPHSPVSLLVALSPHPYLLSSEGECVYVIKNFARSARRSSAGVPQEAILVVRLFLWYELAHRSAFLREEHSQRALSARPSSPHPLSTQPQNGIAKKRSRGSPAELAQECAPFSTVLVFYLCYEECSCRNRARLLVCRQFTAYYSVPSDEKVLRGRTGLPCVHANTGAHQLALTTRRRPKHPKLSPPTRPQCNILLLLRRSFFNWQRNTRTEKTSSN